MATHSSILAWKLLWTEEPGGLLSIALHRVGHSWSDLACRHALERETATHMVFLQETVLPKTQKTRIRSPLEGSESNIFIYKTSDSKSYLLKGTLQKYTVLLYLKYPISLKKKKKVKLWCFKKRLLMARWHCSFIDN